MRVIERSDTTLHVYTYVKGGARWLGRTIFRGKSLI